MEVIYHFIILDEKEIFYLVSNKLKTRKRNFEQCGKYKIIICDLKRKKNSLLLMLMLFTVSAYFLI